MKRKTLNFIWIIWVIILVCCVLTIIIFFIYFNVTLLVIGLLGICIEIVLAGEFLWKKEKIIKTNKIRNSIINEIVDLNKSDQFEYITTLVPKFGIAIPKNKEGIIISIKKNKDAFDTIFISKEAITKCFIKDKYNKVIKTGHLSSTIGAATGAVVGGVVGAIVGAALMSDSQSSSDVGSEGAWLVIHHDPLSPSVILKYESSIHAIETIDAINKFLTKQ